MARNRGGLPKRTAPEPFYTRRLAPTSVPRRCRKPPVQNAGAASDVFWKSATRSAGFPGRTVSRQWPWRSGMRSCGKRRSHLSHSCVPRRCILVHDSSLTLSCVRRWVLSGLLAMRFVLWTARPGGQTTQPGGQGPSRAPCGISACGGLENVVLGRHHQRWGGGVPVGRVESRPRARRLRRAQARRPGPALKPGPG